MTCPWGGAWPYLGQWRRSRWWRWPACTRRAQPPVRWRLEFPDITSLLSECHNQGLVHSVHFSEGVLVIVMLYKYISCLNWTAPTVSTTTPAMTSTTQKWSRLTRPPQHSSPYLRVHSWMWSCHQTCLQRSSMSGTSTKRFASSLLAISWEKPWQRDSGGRGRWWQHKQQPFYPRTFLRVCVCQNSAHKSENKYNCVQIKHFELTRHLRTSRAGPRRPHYPTWRGSCNMGQAQSGEAGRWSEAREFLNYDIDNIRKVTVLSLNKFQYILACLDIH